MEKRIGEIIYREDLYPRLKHDPLIVQKYAEDLTVLPPIEINQDNILIDGWHRLTAFRKAGKESINVVVIKTASDARLKELAVEKNSKYGMQLSQEDKEAYAREIYNITPEKKRTAKKKHIAKILSVSERTISGWLSKIDRDSKVARNKRIFNLWMACYTQEEIAKREEVHKDTISEVCRKMAELQKSDKPYAEHLIDFEVPLYNVWKYRGKSKGSVHPGNTEPTIVDNLLYLYTKPFDIVIDPFAGGGSTIDVCEKRFRRYFVSDRKPVIEREDEIRKWDIVDGLPPVPRWKDVKLVYLDPPYWKQSEGKYSDSPDDLANMPLDDFNKTLSGLINNLAKKLHSGCRIALIIQPTQWNAPDKEYINHATDMIKAVNLPVEMGIQCPYQSEQCNFQMVEWAKENKRLLVISRELVIWRIK